MSLLTRYTLRAHIAPFLFGTSIAMVLFLLQFLMKHLDQLVGKGLDMCAKDQIACSGCASIQ